jgi:hypothetical protein
VCSEPVRLCLSSPSIGRGGRCCCPRRAGSFDDKRRRSLSSHWMVIVLVQECVGIAAASMNEEKRAVPGFLCSRTRHSFARLPGDRGIKSHTLTS